MGSASVSASVGGASVPDSPAAGRQGLRLVLLLLAALALYAIPLGWGLGAGSEWALDEPKLRQIVPELFEGGLGWPQRYPPLHRQLLSALIGTAYPLAEAANRATGIEVDVLLRGLGRALSVTLAIGTLLLVFSIARRLFGTRAALLSALFWLGVAPQAYYAKTMNLDAPYVFWFALALEFFTRLQPEVRARDLVGFALAGGAAILTKDQAGGLFVLPALLILTWIYRAARARGAGALAALGKTAFDPRIAGAALAMLLLVAVVYRFWNGFGELEAHLREISSWNSVGRYQESPNTLAGHLQVAGRSGLNLAFCLGWPGLGVGVAAVARELWLARSSGSRALPLLAFPLSYYLFFVASIRFSFDRFFLPVALVVALFSGGLLARFLETAPRDGAQSRGNAPA
ncbi:MAG: glycosyltransferase family 39 protein, partial [Thermoanaerobaculia bacterium]|nr:glycosyltransferase family 39 protein [Thermoanaerobaculia bacterium]